MIVCETTERAKFYHFQRIKAICTIFSLIMRFDHNSNRAHLVGIFTTVVFHSYAKKSLKLAPRFCQKLVILIRILYEPSF